MSGMTNERIAPEAELAPLPNGPAAAAILAGGIGAAWYGLLVVLVEASPAIKTLLTLSNGVGPLSGKTTFGTLGYLVAWAILAKLWKGKDVDFDKTWKVALVLIGLSLLFTFPPFFKLFAAG